MQTVGARWNVNRGRNGWSFSFKMIMWQCCKAKKQNCVFFGEDVEFDGFPSLMADFERIKMNEVQLSITKAA